MYTMMVPHQNIHISARGPLHPYILLEGDPSLRAHILNRAMENETVRVRRIHGMKKINKISGMNQGARRVLLMKKTQVKNIMQLLDTFIMPAGRQGSLPRQTPLDTIFFLSNLLRRQLAFSF